MSYQEKMEELQRRADIASSRANPERRQMAKDSMRNFFGNLFNKMKPRNNVERQYFGSSPLQQAMAQRDAGMLTPAGERLLQQYEQNAPDEISRQRAMMPSQRHGDYGRVPMQFNQQAPADSINPANSQPIGNQDLTTKDMPEGIAGAVESVDTSNVSQAVESGNTDVLGQQLLLQKMMRNPSKMTSKGIGEMQQMLNNLGFRDKDGNMLDVDGKMGPLTASAMENWKASVPNVSSTNTGQPLASVPVVSGVLRADKYGQGYRADGVVPIENEMAMAQEDIHRYGGRGGMNYGYQNIQNTIGNPDNDPIMFGVDDLSDLTNPFR